MMMNNKQITKHSVTAFALLLITASWGSANAQTCKSNVPLSTDSSEFISYSDGTVTHRVTGLMWKKCQEGRTGVNCELDDPSVVSPVTWRWSLQQASDSTYAGYTDWRVPNIKELASIVEISCFAPAINAAIFPNDPGVTVWSSSTYVNYTPYQWVLDFGYGIDYQLEKSGEYRVRLVRDAAVRE
jgi:hypothetical protein